MTYKTDKLIAQQMLIDLVDGYSSDELANTYSCDEAEADRAKAVAFNDNAQHEEILLSLHDVTDGYNAGDLFHGNLDSTNITIEQVENMLSDASLAFQNKQKA